MFDSLNSNFFVRHSCFGERFMCVTFIYDMLLDEQALT